MTKFEKALENTEALKRVLIKESVKRVLIKELCPVDFGMENNCKMSKDCEECWNQEVES